MGSPDAVPARSPIIGPRNTRRPLGREPPARAANRRGQGPGLHTRPPAVPQGLFFAAGRGSGPLRPEADSDSEPSDSEAALEGVALSRPCPSVPSRGPGPFRVQLECPAPTPVWLQESRSTRDVRA